VLQRARRSGIRPISIGRALLAQLDSQFDHLGSGGELATKYLITLHPNDATRLSAFEVPLLEELRQAVTHHSEIEGYPLTEGVEITLALDASVKRGTCNVTPIVHPMPEPIPQIPHQNPHGESIVPNDIISDAVIVLDNGERISLIGGLATVGRQSDCTIVIDDHNVSRTHAEIRHATNGWVVTDRGSTNGTKVNGEKIVTGRLLMDDDIITFGSTSVRFENP